MKLEELFEKDAKNVWLKKNNKLTKKRVQNTELTPAKTIKIKDE